VSACLLLSLLLTAGFDAGGRVGMAVPASGLERNHNATALVGAGLGYSFGRGRLALDYSYVGLPGRGASAYRLDLHEVTLSFGYEFLYRPAWGLEASVGAGAGFASRSYYAASEQGRAPAAHLGFSFVQHEGKSRLLLGIDNAVYVETGAANGGRRVNLTWLPDLRAGVSYVF
jgi:hypothetical protein